MSPQYWDTARKTFFVIKTSTKLIKTYYFQQYLTTWAILKQWGIGLCKYGDESQHQRKKTKVMENSFSIFVLRSFVSFTA